MVVMLMNLDNQSTILMAINYMDTFYVLVLMGHNHYHIYLYDKWMVMKIANYDYDYY